jgi:hypothetical protein
MALTCGINGSSGQEIIDQINSNTTNILHKEDYLDLPAQDGYVLKSDVNGFRYWEDSTVYWGQIQGNLDNQTDLVQRLDLKYNKSDFIQISTGSADAGKPIVLDGRGYIHSSMIYMESGWTNQGNWTPVPGNEYPDTTGLPSGSFWNIVNVDDTSGYTFQTGDLQGETVFNNNLIIWSADEFSIRDTDLNPAEYYKLDGTYAITAPFAGGGQQLKNIQDGTDNTDAVTVQQLDSGLDSKEDVYPIPTQDEQVMVYSTDGSREYKDYSVNVIKDTWIGDGSSTSFPTSVQYDENNIYVYVNGNLVYDVLDLSDPDYVVFLSPPGAGDVIIAQIYTGYIAPTDNYHSDLLGRNEPNQHEIQSITNLEQELNSKEPSLGLGTAGQILATNGTVDGKEWIDEYKGEDKLSLDGSTPMTGTLPTDTISTADGSVTHNVSTMGIESGSNENGSWIKYPDGTMQIIAEGSVPTDGDTSISIDFIFPQSFIDTSYTTITTLDDAYREGGLISGTYSCYNS